MENSRKINKMKLVFGIAIPMLVIVVTMVMVGVSFAWFSNADKVTVSEITFSTAQSYGIEFNMDGTSNLYDNIEYFGQEALTTLNGKGMLITPDIAGDNAMLKNNTAFYFVNTVKLNTEGNAYDISMAFDYISIYKPILDDKGNKQINSNGAIAGSEAPLMSYSESNLNNVPYVFTWMFKEHTENVDGKATNYDSDGKSMRSIMPTANEIWYTPYGTLTFDSDGLVASVNGKRENIFSIEDVESTSITNFTTNDEGNDGLYDFYIIFAPEKLFYMQFFSEDKDQYGIEDVYPEQYQTICGLLTNKMYYSDLQYSGVSFEFSALISVNGMSQENSGGGLNE